MQRVEDGTVALDTTLASSAPGSLLSVMKDGNAGHAYLVLPISGTPTKVTYAFDARLVDVNEYVEMVELHLAYPSLGSCAIQPTLSGDTLQVNEYCVDTAGVKQELTHVIGAVDAASAGWHTIAVAVDFGARSFVVDVTSPVGGTFRSPSVRLNDRVVAGTSTLRTGIGYARSRIPGTKLRVDNVTIDW